MKHFSCVLLLAFVGALLATVVVAEQMNAPTSLRDMDDQVYASPNDTELHRVRRSLLGARWMRTVYRQFTRSLPKLRVLPRRPGPNRRRPAPPRRPLRPKPLIPKKPKVPPQPPPQKNGKQ
ncbi:uncharacterized protein [Periplaneta americana]|uniref:uncharacterized protein isoform X2 n=1 Tax=Periplaneta americana TaxID=6978 RepID=UPI0037E7A184